MNLYEQRSVVVQPVLIKLQRLSRRVGSCNQLRDVLVPCLCAVEKVHIACGCAGLQVQRVDGPTNGYNGHIEALGIECPCNGGESLPDGVSRHLLFRCPRSVDQIPEGDGVVV